MADKPIYINGKYTGRNLNKEGEKDGKAWKQYKLQFEIDSDGMLRTWNFWAFDSIGTKSGSKGLQLKDLEEGQTYSIGYEEVDFKRDGETYKLKKCFFVGIAVENEDKPITEPEKNPIGDPSESEKSLIKAYLDGVQPSDWGNSHWIGTYVRTTASDTFLVKRLEHLFKTYIHPKSEVKK